MNTFNNNLLSTANHLSSKLAPIIMLFDKLLGRITPQMTAQACGGYYCSLWCPSTCGTINGIIAYNVYTRFTAQPGCNGANCWESHGCTYCG